MKGRVENRCIKIVSEIAQIDLAELEAFVLSHPHGNFFQSTKAFQFYQAVNNNQPILLVAKDGEKIVGSLLAVIIREGKGPKGFFSRRCIVSGGPLVVEDDVEICAELLSALNEKVRNKAIYTQFRNFYDMSSLTDAFTRHGWVYEEHLNILVDLAKSEENLWKEVSSKRRNTIRRASKEGTIFALVESRAELEATLVILKDVYARAKLPFPEDDYFYAAFDFLSPENLKVYVAINKNKIIGTMYCLCFKETLYDWYAGASQDHYNQYPNDLIPWQVFLWGQQNGYKQFDFGGAGKPDKPYGVRDYKKQFGGEFVNFGRYEKIHQPLLFQIGKAGFWLLQKVKR